MRTAEEWSDEFRRRWVIEEQNGRSLYSAVGDIVREAVKEALEDAIRQFADALQMAK